MAVGLSKPIQMAVEPLGPRRSVHASRSEPVAPVKVRVPPRLAARWWHQARQAG
jgi:hypothetical protein